MFNNGNTLWLEKLVLRMFVGASIAEHSLYYMSVGASIAEHPLYYLFVGAGIDKHPPLDPDIVYEALVAGVVPQ